MRHLPVRSMSEYSDIVEHIADVLRSRHHLGFEMVDSVDGCRLMRNVWANVWADPRSAETLRMQV